jgi:hypothetical protein
VAPGASEHEGIEYVNGKGLYQWIKDFERVTGQRILGEVSQWGHRQGYPIRVLEWTEFEVSQAREYIDTIRKDRKPKGG